MRPPRSTDSSWDCVGIFLGWLSRLAMQFWCIAIPPEKLAPVEISTGGEYPFFRAESGDLSFVLFIFPAPRLRRCRPHVPRPEVPRAACRRPPSHGTRTAAYRLFRRA